MEYGHVKLSRKFFASDPFWNERRVFSRSEAWVDLIQRAAWKDHTRLVGGAIIELSRGEILASIRFLAEAWNWGEQRVRTFIALLKKMDRILTQRETQAGTVYLLVNYDTYQGGNAESDTADNTPITHRQHTHNTKRSSKAVKAGKETTLSGRTPDPVQQVFQHWQSVSGHQRSTLTKDRRAKIKARLQSYSAEDLCSAIENACADPFMQGDNDRQTRYDFPETILKTDAKVDQWLSKNAKKPQLRLVVND